MKYYLSFLLLLILTIGAHSQELDKFEVVDYTFTLSNGDIEKGLEIVGYHGTYPTDGFVIPDEIEGKPVFRCKSPKKELVLPSRLRVIGKRAISSCSKLQESYVCQTPSLPLGTMFCGS
ncbi:hypothetical protein K4L44_05680 [Halosquirtibacter laminarini]|uniref:Uncharacterized protein n=1 Tax=Halosquirtibacter laminarini TaxID=3374600 RepID=A0AC61NIF4_9BACT|nr:hypothetical protein K4L44_05680 [Prolixibacteraceae bacterium]